MAGVTLCFLSADRSGCRSICRPKPARSPVGPPCLERERTMRCLAFLAASLVVVCGAGDSDLDVVTQKNGHECGLEGKPGGSEAQKDLNRHKNRYDAPD